MPRLDKSDSIIKGAEKISAALTGFDYRVDEGDFVLYELHRLIDEERASFDNPEFRMLIDQGVRAHIEENLEIRGRLAGILRSPSVMQQASTVALRIVHALEDLDSDLCNVGVLVRSYTSYLLARLEALALDSSSVESDSTDRLSDAADLLFESTGDRDAAETALSILCSARSPVSARILAHAIAEPLLDEDLEAQAFTALKALWPLPRHYMFYNLKDHPHEDIPVRWFQLFTEVDELTVADLVLEEFRAHGESPHYHEDLAALLEVLHGCRDPELEDKVLSVLNAQATGRTASALLRTFIEDHRAAVPQEITPWAAREQELSLNRRYVAAAALFEQGREEAGHALDEILALNPSYPFALMLKNVLRESR